MRATPNLLFACLLAGTAVAQSPVTLTVDTQSPGYAIPADFSGLSFETMTLLPDSTGGYWFSATNTPLITLFQNLGLKSLRIGGATVDMATVAIPTNNDIDHLFAFAQAAGVKVIYSLRLLNGSTNTDATLAQYIWTHYRTQLDSFAIGNEPDWNSYHQSDPNITNYTSYLADWQKFATAITNVVPGATFSGPDTGGNVVTGAPNNGPGPTWTTSFALAEEDSGLIACITQHDYVGEGAGNLTAQQGIEAMLSPAWNTGSNQTLYTAMGGPVLQNGLPYRFTEANDFTGGVTNASNAFASALWALDFMQWWAAHGASGVNFHNKRWIPTDTIIPGSSGQLITYPKGYGIKAFDLGSHGYVEPLTMTNASGLNLTAYAVGDGAELYVTIINKEQGTGARDAAVTIVPDGFSSGSAAAIFLTAPNGNVAATDGVTLGGAAITNNTPWLGQWTTLNPVTNGQCTVIVSAASAAVVKIQAATLFAPPVIMEDLPAQVTLVTGKAYTYSVGLNGVPPFGYQWYHGAAPLVGQTNATYSLMAGNPGVSTYSVVIANSYGAVTSAVSTLTVIGPLTDSYATNLLSYGPVGYWPLQETSAPAPANLETNYGTLGRLGNAYYAATDAANVAFGQPGALAGDTDASVGFSGGTANPNSYAFVPRVSPALTIQAPFTLEAWINPSGTAYGLALGEGGGTGLNGSANFGGWQMGLGASGGNNKFQMQYYTGVGSVANNGVASAPFYTLGRWYHYVVTYDGAASTMYVNGSNIFSAISANAPDTWSPLGIGAGKWDYGPIGGIRWLQGSEDEVAVYTNVLLVSRIAAHYAAGASASSNYTQTVLADNPLLYYRMDNPVYTNPGPALCPAALNFGSAPVNGLYPPGTVPAGVSGPPFAGLGTNSVACPINGVFSCVDAGCDPAFNPTGTQPFSGLLWFKGYPADGRVQTLMSQGTNWAIILDGTTGRIAYDLCNVGSIPSTKVLNDGNWHMAAGVFNGTTGGLYVDGVLNVSAAVANGLAGEPGVDLLLGGNADFTGVGTNQQYFAGAIAQAAFFTNALTAAQIQRFYSVATVPTISLADSGNNPIITYTGTLLSSTNVAGPYSPVTGASSPYPVPQTDSQRFYRTRNP